MKKLIAVVLSVLLCLSCLSCFVAVSAEAGEITPVLLFDGPNLNVPGGLDCAGTYDYEQGYITLRAVGGDPYYSLYSGNPICVGPYLSFKYRTSDPIEQGQFWAMEANGGINVNSSFKVDYEADGQWHVMTVYLPDVLPATFEDGGVPMIGFDPSTNLLGCLRFDFNDAAQVGETMDIEYLAFFNSLEDAQNYRHRAPCDALGHGEDGSTATFTFDSVTAAKWRFVMEHRWVDVRMEEGGPGYVTFVAEGADPYLQFQDPAFSIPANEASYVVAKYKTEAQSHSPMKMEFFTNIEGVAQWGPDTYASADLINDGVWHYVLVDATQTIGQHTEPLYAFRMDPLGQAEAGESIDMEMVKFFADRETVWSFFEALADEGDVEAQEFLDTHSFSGEDPQPVETTTAEPETEAVTEPAVTVETDTEATTETEVSTDSATDTEAVPDTTAADDITTAVDTTAKVEDTTAAPAAEGCKAVMASASVLGIIALAAGIAVRKKD